MSNRSIELNEALYAYLLDNSLREPAVLKRLREETAGLEMARMQISPEQGQFMALLARIMNAKRYVEVGTFTGYSALVMTLAMGKDASVFALDSSAEWTAMGKKYWSEAGVSDQIQLLLADAHTSLQTLQQTHADQIDMMFVDADKTSYKSYIESAYLLLRTGGLLMIDNTLWGGAVADPADSEPDTLAIRAVNRAMLADTRFEISLVPIGDGLTLAIKR